MIRLPVIPTLVVALAAALMIGLGIWQLHRATWKTQLLDEYARNAMLPPADLDPLIANGRIETTPLAFRRALVTCHSEGVKPKLREGRSTAEEPGYAYLLPCRPGAGGLAGRLMVNAGWSTRPDAAPRIAVDGLVAGTLGAIGSSGPVTLTSARAAPPLQPGAPPTMADVPNNHMSYAVQWFFFAATAVVIYLIALRRRQRGG